MEKNKNNISVLIFAISLCLFTFLSVSAQKKVACVGNSITYGYGLSNPSSQSYPSQMQIILGASGWNVGNFGSSGRTMLKNSGYSYWDDRKYREAKQFGPNCVMIELGTNDSKRWLWDWLGSQFKVDYKDMVLSFLNNRRSPNPEIWIGLLIPGNNYGWDFDNAYIKDKVNPVIKEIALEMGLGLVDLYTPFVGHWSDWYQIDSIHPTVAGAGVIAQKVAEMLLMPKPNITFANGTVSALYGYDFQWYFNGVPVAANQGGNLKDLVVTQSGKFKVSIKINSTNETRILSNELIVSYTKSAYTGVEESRKVEVSVYPNPASTAFKVNVNNPSEIVRVTIFDISGHEVETIAQSAIKSSMELGSSLKPDMYVVHVYGTNWTKSYKVLKTK